MELLCLRADEYIPSRATLAEVNKACFAAASTAAAMSSEVDLPVTLPCICCHQQNDINGNPPSRLGLRKVNKTIKNSLFDYRNMKCFHTSSVLANNASFRQLISEISGIGQYC